MPSRPTKSANQVDLPDWAADVTPNDEVMEKFYAPTGFFPSGPLTLPSSGPSPFVNPTTPDNSPKQPETRVSQRTPVPPAKNQAPHPRQKKKPFVTSLPFAKSQSTPASPKPASNTGLIPSVTPSHDNSFTVDFARKWRIYLYTGQLSVMRVLYIMTVAQGTNECVTSYATLATATNMTRRNCIRVVQSLVSRGFIEQLQTMNDGVIKGMRLRLHLEPSI